MTYKCDNCGTTSHPIRKIITEGGIFGGTKTILECIKCKNQYSVWEYGEVEEPENIEKPTGKVTIYDIILGIIFILIAYMFYIILII